MVMIQKLVICKITAKVLSIGMRKKLNFIISKL